MDKQSYLPELGRYVVLNPVRAEIVCEASNTPGDADALHDTLDAEDVASNDDEPGS